MDLIDEVYSQKEDAGQEILFEQAIQQNPNIEKTFQRCER